jgi:hypothetical protein
VPAASDTRKAIDQSKYLSRGVERGLAVSPLSGIGSGGSPPSEKSTLPREGEDVSRPSTFSSIASSCQGEPVASKNSRGPALPAQKMNYQTNFSIA